MNDVDASGSLPMLGKQSSFSGVGFGMNTSGSGLRGALCAWLETRREEIEGVVLNRVHAVVGDAGIEDGEYGDGLRKAVLAGVADGIVSTKGDDAANGSVPAPLLAQARQAASRGVPLDVVLRRYFAGYASFTDFVVQAAEEEVAPGRVALRSVLVDQAARFERIAIAVSSEYTRERGHRSRPPEQHRTELVTRLLAGQYTRSVAGLAYDLDAWHVGIVGRGQGALTALRDAGDANDCQMLLVRPRTDTVWVWFGGRRRDTLAEVADRISPAADDAVLALGEPARGIEGWRLTHRQATAALRVMQRDRTGVVRYVDVGLLASVARDQVLVDSLRALYLAPLAVGRTDGGAVLRETLDAYFRSGRNVSSAAAALAVSRQTVANRLKAVEERLGRTIERCAPELEVALRMGLGEHGRLAPHPAAPLSGSE